MENENKPKIYLEDFLEKYPNAPIKLDGSPYICPCDLGYESIDGRFCKRNLYGTCVECWSRPMKNEEETNEA